MSYLIITTAYPPRRGGIAHYLGSLATALQAAGQETLVVALDEPEAATHDAGSTVPVVRVERPARRLAVPGRLDWAAREAVAGLTTPLAGIIAGKWFPDAQAGLQAREALRAPVGMLGLAREFADSHGNPLRWLAQRRVLRQVDLALAISTYTAAQLKRAGLPAERVHMVGAGVEAERYQPDPARAATLREAHGLEGRPVVLTVARLVEQKGHLTTLRALPALIREFPTLAHVIVGEGPQRPALEAAVRSLGLEGHVIFTGRVPPEDLPGYYTMAEMMVLASLDDRRAVEGFGLVFLEANCCGTAVIGTSVGGIPDAIAEGHSGLLVPADDPTRLGEAILSLLRDPERARQMGLEGQRRAREQFAWDNTATRVVEAFKALENA